MPPPKKPPKSSSAQSETPNQSQPSSSISPTETTPFNNSHHPHHPHHQHYSQPHLHKIYHNLMDDLYIPAVEDMIGKLEEDGIRVSSGFQGEFLVGCVRTDWESTVYQIKHGYFSMELKTIAVGVKSQTLCGKAITSGSFGQILIFQLPQNSKYALKNIKTTKSISSLNSALSQIFIAKLCSSLQTGPKFQKILSYDAILYEDYVQFAMQVCQTHIVYEVLRDEGERRKLLELLKIMHFFHICHLDIKNENIGWSGENCRIVFLDFGLSVIVREPPGYKTKTKFKGSFRYCSPEMKKLFFLKLENYVDLYYNDIYCFKKMWNNIDPELFPNKQQLNPSEISEQYSPYEYFGSLKRNFLIRYLALKMSLFMGHLETTMDLLRKQTELIQTFKKIVENYLQHHIADVSVVRRLQEGCLHLMENFKKISVEKKNSEVDSIFLQVQIGKEDRFPSLLYRQIVEASGSDSEFSKIWDVPLWKEQIFFFVDVYSNAGENREKLVDKIYRNIANVNLPLRQSYTMKFREVLVYYRDYFGVKKNVANLERILTYFVLLRDDYNRDRTEQIILNYWENQGKYVDYLKENFKYFLGKVVIAYQQQTKFLIKNITNITKILKKPNHPPNSNSNSNSNSNPNPNNVHTSPQVITQAKKLQKIMKKILKLWKIYSYHKQQPHFFDEELVGFHQGNFRYLVDGDCFRFVRMVFGGECQVVGEFYGNFYLKKCALVMKINQSINNNCEKLQFSQLLQSQTFFKQFLTYQTLKILNPSPPPSSPPASTLSPKKSPRSLLCTDLQSILLSQNPLHHKIYLRTLLQNCNSKQIQQFSLKIVKQFRLDNIGDCWEIGIFMGRLRVIVTSLLILKFGVGCLVEEVVLRGIGGVIEGFLGMLEGLDTGGDGRQGEFLLEFPSDTSDTEQDGSVMMRKYSHSQKLLKIQAHILNQRPEEVWKDVLEILDQYEVFGEKEGFVCCVYCLSLKDSVSFDNQAYCQLVLKLNQKLQTNPPHRSPNLPLYLYPYFPKFLTSTLHTLLHKNSQNQVLHLLLLTFKQIIMQTHPLAATPIFIEIVQFVQEVEAEVRSWLVGEIFGKGLDLLGGFPGVVFLGYVGWRIGGIRGKEGRWNEEEEKIRRRIVIVCAYFGWIFSGTYFQSFKNHIYYQTYQLTHPQTKHPKLRHIRKLASHPSPSPSPSPTSLPSRRSHSHYPFLALTSLRQKNANNVQISRKQQIKLQNIGKLKKYLQNVWK